MMRISVDNKILEKYPNAEIGYLVALVAVRETDAFVENLKKDLIEHVKERGINATNFAIHPKISVWRNIYKNDFHVKETTYRSSIEALVKRSVTGKSLWNICNIVDLYNCCSIMSLLPMGGYDIKKISGDITIRYAQEGELFHGIGEKLKIQTKSEHVINADNQKVMCWLWNHKDAYETCIDESTKYVLFFIDSVDGFNSNMVQEALERLSNYLTKIECFPISSGVLNHAHPCAHVSRMEDVVK